MRMDIYGLLNKYINVRDVFYSSTSFGFFIFQYCLFGRKHLLDI